MQTRMAPPSLASCDFHLPLVLYPSLPCLDNGNSQCGLFGRHGVIDCTSASYKKTDLNPPEMIFCQNALAVSLLFCTQLQQTCLDCFAADQVLSSSFRGQQSQKLHMWMRHSHWHIDMKFLLTTGKTPELFRKILCMTSRRCQTRWRKELVDFCNGAGDGLVGILSFRSAVPCKWDQMGRGGNLQDSSFFWPQVVHKSFSHKKFGGFDIVYSGS